MSKQTTTGPAGRLTAEQRAALTLAESQDWAIAVEGAGQVVQLRQGRPNRALVLALAAPGAAIDGAERPAPLTTTTTNGPTTAAAQQEGL